MGLDIAASLPVPGLAAAVDAPDAYAFDAGGGARTLAITLGAVPASLPDPLLRRPLLTVGRDRAALFHIPSIAAYHLPTPDRMVIAPAPGVDAARALDFALGTPLALAAWGQGLAVLRAGVAVRDGRAAVIATDPGLGGSSLTMGLVRRGWRLAADGLCALDLGPDGAARLWPWRPQVRLWGDAVTALAQEERRARATQSASGRFILPMDDVFAAAPARPVVLLQCDEARGGTAPRHQLVKGSQRLTLAAGLQVLSDAALHLAPTAPFPALTALARVPCHRMSRAPQWDAMASVLDRIEDVAGLTPMVTA